MTPWLQDPDVTLYHGDCLQVLRELPSSSVHMCATSPPFYGLRDYGTGEWEGGDPDCDHKRPDGQGKPRPELPNPPAGWAERDSTVSKAFNECPCGARRVDKQIGLEETPDQWVERLVAVFREVRRVLRDDGTLWVEIGDSYLAQQGTGFNGQKRFDHANLNVKANRSPDMKPKDLLGQPWLLAFALRADGWWLRSEIIWARPNPMPESVTDRPTKSHSTVFLLSKQPRYYYDADAIRETAKRAGEIPGGNRQGVDEFKVNGGWAHGEVPASANARSVWNIPTQPTPFAHFATWPEALVRRMILAGTSERGCCPECVAPWTRDVERIGIVRRDVEGTKTEAKHKQGLVTALAGAATGTPTSPQVRTLGWSPSCTHQIKPVPCTVLDPFAGSATTMLVARNHRRHSIGIELNEDYLQIAGRRLQQLSLLA